MNPTTKAEERRYDNQFEPHSDEWFDYDREYNEYLNQQLAETRNKISELGELL